MYRPHVVRVVSDENILTEAVKPRSLKTLVRCYTEMAQPNWQKRRDEVCRRVAAMEREVAALEYTLSANSQSVNRDNANTAHTSPESIQLAMVSFSNGIIFKFYRYSNTLESVLLLL